MVKITALNCPSCGAKVSKDTKKCEYCGTELVISEDEVRLVAVSSVSCPKCGGKLEKDAEYCKECGEKVTIKKGLLDALIIGKPSRSNLIFGFFLVILGLGTFLFIFYIFDFIPEIGVIEPTILKDLIRTISYLSLFTLLVGVVGGYHFGRYIEMKFNEKRKSKQM